MDVLLRVFKGLADQTRLRILKLLSGGELCVCEIAAALGVDQPRLSFHLSVLKKAGFITDRRQQRWILYRLNEEDLFIRFLLLAVAERVPEEMARLDRGRLASFPGRESAGKVSVKNGVGHEAEE